MLILYTFQLIQSSASPSHVLISMVSILTVSLSLRLLCPDLSDPSSLTECTSDNQHLGTSNFTTSAAKHSTLKSQLDWGTIRWPVFRVNKLRCNYASTGKRINVALIAIMPFDTTALAKDT